MSDSRIPSQYRDMVEKSLREGTSEGDRPLKRRKRDTSPRSPEVIVIDDIVDEGLRESKSSNVSDVPKEMESSDSDADFDSDEFEDVDLDINSLPDKRDEQINITLKKAAGPAKKPKKKATVVSREERMFRRQLHMMYICVMVAHGVCRNAWCSDKKLLAKLRAQLPNNIINECARYQKESKLKDVSSQSKTRKLLDLLRHLMVFWYTAWTIDSGAPVIFKKGWNELNMPVSHQKMSKKKFSKCVRHHSGSRDVAAQGFVSLLRSIGLQARLVFSLQPPDFTNLAQVKEYGELKPKEHKHVSRKKGVSQQERLLNTLRGRRHAYTNVDPGSDATERYSSYPTFWIEVWDGSAKRFITVDPIVKKTIEIVKLKSQLEPPSTDIRNNAYYVIGFDRLGGVRDITRRYAEAYNAKVRKKRITRTPEGEEWYNSVLDGSTTINRLKLNRIDQFEELEFEELSLKEGMPNSIQDFRNHPVYALEEQLKANEILDPKTPCGSIRKRTRTNKDEVLLPVYKRKNVHTVRSAKAWFMRGRVLKMGQRPLKIREAPKISKNKTEDNYKLSDGDEEEVRLYAEKQTEQYVPPPIKNGTIPKNVYGNIDVYRPWMVPEGCVHITDQHAEKAAKIMGIEYAPAAVGFDFQGDRRMHAVEATVKIQGIVTFEEYEDAVKLLCEGLKEQEEENARRRDELIALRAWKIVLSKLRITNRLNKELGVVDDSQETEHIDPEDNALSEDERDEEDYAGGFMLNDAQNVDEKLYFGGSESGSDPEEEQVPYEVEPKHEEEPRDEEETEPMDMDDYEKFMAGVGLDEGDDNSDGGEFVTAESPEKSESPEQSETPEKSETPENAQPAGLLAQAAQNDLVYGGSISDSSSSEPTPEPSHPIRAEPTAIVVKEQPVKTHTAIPSGRQDSPIEISDAESETSQSSEPSLVELDEYDDQGYEFDYSDTD